MNLGDYITEVLVKRLGYDTITYSEISSNQSVSTCLLGVGSILDCNWFDRIKLPKQIWGCGYWGDPRFRLSRYPESKVHAVRGPITRDLLGLPRGTPTGDPALLLPKLFPDEVPLPPANQIRDISYIPHFNKRDHLDKHFLSEIGATKFIDIACCRGDFWSRVREVAHSEFVLTSSLHGAILAQAYGVPWALCSWYDVDKPLKWLDWFAYLGVTGAIARNHREAVEWWAAHGSGGRIADLDPLLQSFPHDAAQQATGWLQN